MTHVLLNSVQLGTGHSRLYRHFCVWDQMLVYMAEAWMVFSALLIRNNLQNIMDVVLTRIWFLIVLNRFCRARKTWSDAYDYFRCCDSVRYDIVWLLELVSYLVRHSVICGAIPLPAIRAQALRYFSYSTWGKLRQFCGQFSDFITFYKNYIGFKCSLDFSAAFATCFIDCGISYIAAFSWTALLM